MTVPGVLLISIFFNAFAHSSKHIAIVSGSALSASKKWLNSGRFGSMFFDVHIVLKTIFSSCRISFGSVILTPESAIKDVICFSYDFFFRDYKNILSFSHHVRTSVLYYV